MGLKLIWVGAFIDAAVTAKVFAGQTRFSNTITLGTVLVGMMVVIVAGFFTIRANTARIWRENYEGEKTRAEHLASELIRVSAEKDAEILEQRTLKHAALSDAAAWKLKTDQTKVLQSITQLGETTAEVSKAVAGILETTGGLVQSVEKLNRRLDSIEDDRQANGKEET